MLFNKTHSPKILCGQIPYCSRALPFGDGFWVAALDRLADQHGQSITTMLEGELILTALPSTAHACMSYAVG